MAGFHYSERLVYPIHRWILQWKTSLSHLKVRGCPHFILGRKKKFIPYRTSLNERPIHLKGLWEIPWGLLETTFSRSRFLHFCNHCHHTNDHLTIWPNSMPFQRYNVKRRPMTFPQINSSLFSYIFKRASIFSFIDFLTKIFTSQYFLWCVLSHQGDYSEFHFCLAFTIVKKET